MIGLLEEEIAGGRSAGDARLEDEVSLKAWDQEAWIIFWTGGPLTSREFTPGIAICFLAAAKQFATNDTTPCWKYSQRQRSNGLSAYISHRSHTVVRKQEASPSVWI